jgi:hypothetical protein
MKNIIVLLSLLCVGTFAFAHPPKDVVLSYDAATKILNVVVTHDISQSKASDPTKHFVKELSVKINGKDVSLTAYKYQQFPEGETISFKLDLKSGDKVSVNAKCSLAGEKTSDYTVK